MDTFSGIVVSALLVAAGAIMGASAAYPAGIEQGKVNERKEIARMGLGRYAFDGETGGAKFEYGRSQSGWVYVGRN